MVRKISLMCLAAVILCGTGIALAAAVKVHLMPYNAIEPDASGRAVLNYAKGADKTEVQVNCWGLMPDEMYTVWLSPDGGTSYHPIGSFTTDEYGEGNLHAKLPGDHSGHLPVAVNNAGNATVLLGQ